MDLQRRVDRQFNESIEVKRQVAPRIAASIVDASQVLVRCLLNDSRILCCGHGPSAVEAQHLSALLLNRFERERPGLPSFALNSDAATIAAISSDHGLTDVFAKQIRALGQQGDVLLVVLAGLNAPDIAAAIRAGHDRGLTVIALCGEADNNTPDSNDDGLNSLLRSGDVEIRISSDSVTRIREVHVLAIHCLCDLIDTQLFGEET